MAGMTNLYQYQYDGKKLTTCSKWRGRCETGGDNEDVPLSLSMVEGEGDASGGGLSGGEFGQFFSIHIRRDDISMEGVGRIFRKQGTLGSS